VGPLLHHRAIRLVWRGCSRHRTPARRSRSVRRRCSPSASASTCSSGAIRTPCRWSPATACSTTAAASRPWRRCWRRAFDSEWADAYTWAVDIADIANVLRWLGRPCHLLGHSKGGGQATDAACIAPEHVLSLINIDGFGPPPFDEPLEETPERFAQYLDGRRRRGPQHAWRAYPSLDDLIRRRKAQNPRLSEEWLRYFLFHGARESEDGWRWKCDPMMGDGFGPWVPDWVGPGWVRLRAPLLAITGSERDTWGPLPESILGPRLAHAPRVVRRTIDGAGHFVHIERPAETAAAILDFLDS
jgi:pimeloyl-ACP methyl ester carboxylesterase